MSASDCQMVPALVEKLDHPLEEIKCRALENILSKLQRSLLFVNTSVVELIAQKLLIWIDSHPLLGAHSVLKTLKILVKQHNAKSVIVYFGGLATLTRMRNAVTNIELKQLIDEITMELSDSALDCYPEGTPATANGLQKSTVHRRQKHTSGYFNFSGSSILGNSSSYLGLRQQATVSGIDHLGSFHRFFNSSNSEQLRLFNSSLTSGATYQRKFVLHFPLLTLTKTDSDVLHASLKSLKSTENDVILAGIHFFEEVILQDFPAEIFLQRTAFVESLLNALVSRKMPVVHAAISALIALCEKLLCRVYYHLDPNNFSVMPDFDIFCMTVLISVRKTVNEKCYESPDRSNTDSSAGGGPISANAAPAPNLPESAVVGEMGVCPELDNRCLSLTVLEFVCEVLRFLGHAVLPIVGENSSIVNVLEPKDAASDKDRNIMQHSHYRLEGKTLRLMRVAVDLFLAAVQPLTNPRVRVLQKDETDEFTNWMLIHVPPRCDLISPMDLPPNFVVSLEPWVMLLSTLSSSWIHHGPALGAVGWSATEFSHLIDSNAIPHEYERHMFVGVLNILFYLIASLFTPETALTVVPAELRAQFSMVLMDTSMLCTPCEFDHSAPVGLPAYVTLFSSAIFSTWKLLTRLQHAMRSLVQFLHYFEMRSEDETMFSESLMHFAVDGLDALEIVGSTRFASSFVEFLNEVSISEADRQPDMICKGQTIMLRLLSHPNDSIRKTTYTQLHQVIQIRGSAERLLTGLLNGYTILPQATWRTLHRLILLQTTSPEPFCGTVRPLSVSLAPYARVPQNQNERDNLGALALDWCLGFMTARGRQMWDNENQSLNYFSNGSIAHDDTSDHVIASVCRLLMNPIPEVRSRAAVVLCNYLRHFCDRFIGTQSASQTSYSDSVRHVDGASVASESRSTVLDNLGQTSTLPTGLSTGRCDSEHKTSTPLLQLQKTDLKATADRLANSFIPVAYDSSGFIPAPPLLDQDNVPIQDPNQTADQDQLAGLLQVMQLLTDRDSDLGVRRAAGEQVAILIRHPPLLSSWLTNHGLEASCDLVLNSAQNLLRRAIRSDSSELFQPSSISMLPTSSVLLPILSRILRYAVIWSALARNSLFRKRDFVLHLIYLSHYILAFVPIFVNLFSFLYLAVLVAHPDSGGLHGHLIDLVTLIVFSPVIQSSEESPVCLPVGVASGFRLPFICPTYSFRLLWQDQENSTFKPLTDLLTVSMNASNEDHLVLEALLRRSIRCSWSIACHGSATLFIRHCLAVLGALPDAQKVDPVILDRNFKWIREYSPHPVSSFLLSLTAVQQASSHANLVRALGMLLRSVHAHRLQEDTRLISTDPGGSENHQPDKVCWWLRAQLDRFLRTLPACSADFHLLSSLLETIDEVSLCTTIPSVMALGSNTALCQWLLSVLVDKTGPLAYSLLQPGAGIGETDSRRLVSAKRRLIYHRLPRLLTNLTARLSAVEFCAVQRNLLTACGLSETCRSASENKRIEFLELCLQWGYKALISFMQDPFSDLVRLRLTLGVLCNVTASCSVCLQRVRISLVLIKLRALALCILAQLCRIPSWAKHFSSHQISLETQTLLSTHNRCIPQFGGKLWYLALSHLLDANECCAIRVQAVHLLLNLTALPMNPRECGIFLPPSLDRPGHTDVRLRPETGAVRGSSQSHSGSTPRNGEAQEEEDLGVVAAESRSVEISTGTSDRLPAGDRPTITVTDAEEDANTLDLRVLFNSDLESSEMRENFAELLEYLQPWFNELFSTSETLVDQVESTSDGNGQINVDRGDRSESLNPSSSGRPSLLLHISEVPRSSLLPCCYDSNGGDSAECEQHASGCVVEQSSRPNVDSSIQRSGTNDNLVRFPVNVLCTPLLVSALCQLLVNLLHRLPKFMPTELMRLRIHALLMNIVDPNLLEAIASDIENPQEQQNVSTTRWRAQNTWLAARKHLVHCFANCLQVLRCQAAMHLATRSALKSDALFLARLIRSLKHYSHLEVWAPLWREVFALLTCLMIVLDPGGSDDQDLRLILQPLSARVDSWLKILLAMVDRAEIQLNSLQSGQSYPRKASQLCCKQARSALNFFIVALSYHRPLLANPVVEAIDALHQEQNFNQKDRCKSHHGPCSPSQDLQKPDIVIRLTRRLMVLVSSSSVLVDKASSGESYVYVVAYRRALRSALQTLLGCCRTAKVVAVEDTFLYRCAPHNRVRLTIRVLAHRLWPLALQDVRVLHALLALLTNLSADCPYAASALATNTAVSRPHPVTCFFAVNQSDLISARSGGPVRNRSSTGTFSGRNSPAYTMVDAPGAPSTTQSLVQYVCRLLGPLENSSGSLDYGLCIPSTDRMSAVGSTSGARVHSVQPGSSCLPEVRFEQEVTTRYIFQLLSNLVWAPEARNVLLKTKLLSRFPELDARALVKSRRGQFVLSLWIQLLTSLSFTKQGQQMLFTQPLCVYPARLSLVSPNFRSPYSPIHSHTCVIGADMSDTLTACVRYSKPGDIREAALLTLRNLCTNSTFKSRLLTGDTHVLDCLRDLILNEMGSLNESENLIAIAVSSVEALIYGNQKVRALVRSSGFLRHLTQLWTNCQKTSCSGSLLPKIEHVMNLLQN
ncbi:hypothetical protein FGIG_03409 [Fasciola gigantica]|uniref:Rotatin N-terminal domain-containing protein n=1 Tax=Fasciola gigantica TaxID=46835 RepID=A0A504YI05_FASGI|nr:hypothetical protein FGIG_03409 [Fasciola gigantica]